MDGERRVMVNVVLEEEKNKEKEITEEDWAYAAGFFDGDGNIYIRKRKGKKEIWNSTYSINVSIGNTDKDIIIWLKDKFGGGIRNHIKQKEYHKQAYQWRVSGKIAYNFLKLIYPYLILKKYQAGLSIEFYEFMKESHKHLRKKGVNGSVKISKENILKREEYRNLILSFSGDGENFKTKTEISNNEYENNILMSYCAGIMDSEGCITISRNSVIITVSNTDPGITNWLKNNFGGFITTYKSKKDNRKDSCRWVLKCGDSLDFLYRILLHLKIKSEQARICIDLQKMKMGQSGIKISNERNEKMKILKEKITILNRRGI